MKARRSQLYLTVITFLCVCEFSYGQQLSDTLRAKFDVYRKNSLQEKVFVHLDQTFYLTGETMWFTVYVADGSFNKSLSVSQVAYFELINGQESISQIKVELKSGVGKGSLFLPARLKTGRYNIRCYTNWMKNFSPDYYFHQPLDIVNPFIALPENDRVSTSALKVNFFPEGGTLVEGVRSKVAFKITGGSGEIANALGAIVDELKNDTIVKFQPFKFGIGSFYFTPTIGQRYKAVVKFRGKVSTHELPKIEKHGYTMMVSDNDAATVSIKVTTDSAAISSGFLYLFMHTRLAEHRVAIANIRNGSATFTVDRNKLNAGITHFTIFDSDLRPVCERLYFKAPKEKPTLAIATDKEKYGPREKVTLSINTASIAGAVSASISVFKKGSIPRPLPSDISTYLWLTSDLRGPVESPAYYFSSGSDSVKAAVDNLMITQRWGRFKWSEVLEETYNEYSHITEHRGHIINGKIVDLKGTPVGGVLVLLASPDKAINLYAATSNKDGELRFEVKNFQGARKLIAVPMNQDSSYQISFSDSFSDISNSLYDQKQSIALDSRYRDEINSRSIAMQVEDIYREVVELRSGHIDSIPFYGNPDERYLLDAYTRFPVMEEVMREYVSGVMPRKRKDGYHFIIPENISDKKKREMLEDPLVLLDGLPIRDVDRIMEFDPRRIEKIEVISSRYFLGPMMFQGIVSYSTYHGDLGGFEPEQGTVSSTYKGFQVYQKFYAPAYGPTSADRPRTPDRRYLLDWRSHMLTNAEGNSTLEFYTSDEEGEFIIEVQGISDDGRPMNGQQSFLVGRE